MRPLHGRLAGSPNSHLPGRALSLTGIRQHDAQPFRKSKKTKMFNKMIAHFAGEKPKARRMQKDAGLNSSYVLHLRRTYSDVYGK